MLIAGVALAVASLGGLYSLYHLDIRPILGIAAGLLPVLPLLQCLCIRGRIKVYLDSPVRESVVGMFPMADSGCKVLIVAVFVISS